MLSILTPSLNQGNLNLGLSLSCNPAWITKIDAFMYLYFYYFAFDILEDYRKEGYEFSLL